MQVAMVGFFVGVVVASIAWARLLCALLDAEPRRVPGRRASLPDGPPVQRPTAAQLERELEQLRHMREQDYRESSGGYYGGPDDYRD